MSKADDTLFIGRVIEVTGSRIKGELEASVDDLYRTYRSRSYSIGQVGSIVKIEAGDVLVFGVVTCLRMVETEGFANGNLKWLDMDLLGEGIKTGNDEAAFEFKRGVHTYPLPGNNIFVATASELSKIYKKPDQHSFCVGKLTQSSGTNVYLQTNAFLGKHFAILGTTGSGKSCAVSLFIHSILETCPGAHLILLDPHDEYTSAFGSRAETFDLSQMELPHWLLNFEEAVGIFIGKTEFSATSQTNILKNSILRARQSFAGAGTGSTITVDTPVPYKIGDVNRYIETDKNSFSASKQESHLKILNKIETLRSDQRMRFLIREDGDVRDNIVERISCLLRFPVDGKPISILNLSGVPSDIVDIIVSLVARIVFDFAVWRPRDRYSPISFICEEAHRYVPKGDEAIFEPTRRSLARIAKEGRKYGVSLGLVTQRPSEISESVLSQCNTLVTLRMSNDQDQQFVRRALPDSLKSLTDALPSLRTQEAIIVGEGVSVPVRAYLNDLAPDRQPHSKDVQFAETWQTDELGTEYVKTVSENWRKQRVGVRALVENE